MEAVIRQALFAAGITIIQLVGTDNGDFIIVGPKRKVPGNTTLSSSHGGFAGKSIIEKIRDDLDTAYKDYIDKKCTHEGPMPMGVCEDWVEEQIASAMAEGIAHALGLLRSSSADYEWEEAQKRYETTSR